MYIAFIVIFIPYHCDLQESHKRHLKWMTKLPNTSLKTNILWAASAWKIFHPFHIVVRRNFRGTQRSYGKKRGKKVYWSYPVHWVTRDHKYFQKSDQNLVTSQIWFTLTSANKRRGKTARIVKQNIHTSQKDFIFVYIVVTHFKSVYWYILEVVFKELND